MELTGGCFCLSKYEVELPEFPVLTWANVRDFGSDRHLRNPLRLVVWLTCSEVEFKVFNGPANDPKGRIVALHDPVPRRCRVK